MMPTYPNQPTQYNSYDYAAQNPYMNSYRNFGNYNPYNSMPNNQTQPIAPQTPSMPISQQPNNNMQFVLVPSIDVAQNATAEKGQTIYMLNQNQPEIYAKTADGFGLQTTRYFKLIEFNPNDEKQALQAPVLNGDYIPRDEFNKFVAAVSAEIEAIKNMPLTNNQPAVNKPSNNAKKPTQKDDTNDK